MVLEGLVMVQAAAGAAQWLLEEDGMEGQTPKHLTCFFMVRIAYSQSGEPPGFAHAFQGGCPDGEEHPTGEV